MGLDLFGLHDVPQVEAARKDDHTSIDPVVIDQELSIVEPVDSE